MSLVKKTPPAMNLLNPWYLRRLKISESDQHTDKQEFLHVLTSAFLLDG